MAAKKKKSIPINFVPPEKKGWEVYSSRGEMTWYGPNGLRISIHQYIYEPGKWFVSCYAVRLERVMLTGDPSDSKALKKEALDIVRDHVARLAKVLEKAR